MLRRKLDESRLKGVPVNIVAPGERFRVGPFDCALIQVTHSIPEAHALALRTPLGNVLHTGDWKLDPAPLIGALTGVDALEAFGHEGVLAMVGDSTNILNPGTSGSEAEVRDSLMELIGRQSTRVVMTTFASNVARLETAIKVAAASGREVAAVGRSMRRMIEAAREVGYLAGPARPARRAHRGRAAARTGCCGSPPAARASRARRSPGSPPASIRPWRSSRATW